MRRVGSLLILSILLRPGSCFKSVPLVGARSRHGLTRGSPNIVRTNGIAEWKKQSTDGAGELPLLPFSLTEVLLPGQTRYLHFYEEGPVTLGQFSQKETSGVFAMSYFSNQKINSLLAMCTLVEIDEYSVLDVGIGLTVRGVGRGEIEQVVSVDPFLKAQVCLVQDDDAVLAKSDAMSDEAEKVMALHQDLISASKSQRLVASDIVEITTDPRAMLGPGQRWGKNGPPPDSPMIQNLERDGLDGGKDGKDGPVDDKVNVRSEDGQEDSSADDEDDGMQSLRTKARFARAAATRSISAVPRDADEQYIELMFLSFLALEGATLPYKVKAFVCETLNERLGLCAASLEERRKMLAAKSSLRSMFGASSGASEFETDN